MIPTGTDLILLELVIQTHCEIFTRRLDRGRTGPEPVGNSLSLLRMIFGLDCLYLQHQSPQGTRTTARCTGLTV